MEDDVDTKRRLIRKTLMGSQDSDLAADLNKSMIEAGIGGKYASFVIGRVKLIQ